YAGLINLDKGFVIESRSTEAAKAPAKQPLLNNEEFGEEGEWQKWGSDNLWPSRVRKMMEASTIAAPLVFKAVCSMYGTGLTYWQDVRKEGELVKDFSEISEVENFLAVNPVDFISLERMMDYKYFNNIFQEFILDMSSNPKIVETHHLEAEFCRLSVQNKKTNEFDFVGLHGDWENFDPKQMEKIDNVPWRRMTVEQIKAIGMKKRKFATHSKFPSPGRAIYGIPAHQALYNKDGWLTYSNNIPIILNAVFKNGMRIKHHIKIPATYWKVAFPKWDTYSDDQQKTKKKEKIEEMNDWLTGVENSMKSFISEFGVDHMGNKLPGWEIDEIKDSSTFDKELLSSQESDAHISRALGIDPSLAGLQPQGGKMGAGSGSDKRTAFQNAVSMSPAEELVVLDFLYVIGKVNGWPPNLKWGFRHEVPTTLNENKSGKTETV
ncbi:MAG: hypothetical protein R3220_10105, partial [Balneolaceae bacterium]|nr:hypothetical protein [Balneolaceae bacterium]